MRSHGRAAVDGPGGWDEAVHRAANGETVEVISHGDHVADIVPSGELERLRETLDVLADTETVSALVEGLADLHNGHLVSADVIAEDLRARGARQ